MSLTVGLIFILTSSAKPRMKNKVQIDKYSKKIIFLNSKKLQRIISNEKNRPAPPAFDIVDSWKACGFLNSSSMKSFELNLFKNKKKYL